MNIDISKLKLGPIPIDPNWIGPDWDDFYAWNNYENDWVPSTTNIYTEKMNFEQEKINFELLKKQFSEMQNLVNQIEIEESKQKAQQETPQNIGRFAGFLKECREI